MSKNTFVIILGILVTLTSYLGFPQKVKTAFFIVAGLLIAFTTYLIRRENRSRIRKTDVFEESEHVSSLLGNEVANGN